MPDVILARMTARCLADWLPFWPMGRRLPLLDELASLVQSERGLPLDRTTFGNLCIDMLPASAERQIYQARHLESLFQSLGRSSAAQDQRLAAKYWSRIGASGRAVGLAARLRDSGLLLQIAGTATVARDRQAALIALARLQGPGLAPSQLRQSAEQAARLREPDVLLNIAEAAWAAQNRQAALAALAGFLETSLTSDQLRRATYLAARLRDPGLLLKIAQAATTAHNRSFALIALAKLQGFGLTRGQLQQSAELAACLREPGLLFKIAEAALAAQNRQAAFAALAGFLETRLTSDQLRRATYLAARLHEPDLLLKIADMAAVARNRQAALIALAGVQGPGLTPAQLLKAANLAARLHEPDLLLKIADMAAVARNRQAALIALAGVQGPGLTPAQLLKAANLAARLRALEMLEKITELRLDSVDDMRRGDRRLAWKWLAAINEQDFSPRQSRRALAIRCAFGDSERCNSDLNRLRDPGLYVQVARDEAASGQRQIAFGHFRAAQMLRPDAQTLREIALAYQGLGEYAAALDIYNGLLKDSPADSIILGDRGVLQAITGNIGLAQQDLEAAIRENPANLDAALTLGGIYCAAGRGREAILLYDAALGKAGSRKGKSVVAFLAERARLTRALDGKVR
jgi:hypothetical protein